MTTDLTKALADCLDAIEHTGAQLDECLARHPEQRTALRELLPVAAMLRSAPAVVPPLDFRLNARAHLIGCLPARRSRTRILIDGVRSLPRSLAGTVTRRPAPARVLIGLLIVILAGAGVAYASADSLPNDPFYPVKRTIEQTRLALAPDTSSYTTLRLAFAAERLREVDRLIEVGRGPEAIIALNDFGQEVGTAISRVQSMPDAAERQSLIAQITEALDNYETMLGDVEARLPRAAQLALQRTREEIQAALYQPTPSLPPTSLPIVMPTSTVTRTPTPTPARNPWPSAVATRRPTHLPTSVPTWVPPHATYIPTYLSTQWGTLNPTVITTLVPTQWRTRVPTAWPTILPTQWRTLIPTVIATLVPTQWRTRIPTAWPTILPTQWRTLIPTVIATLVPTQWRTRVPTAWPTILPTQWRTLNPTVIATLVPTQWRTRIPTAWPTVIATLVPTQWPTILPTQWSTLNPTVIATLVPTQWRTLVPTAWPTILPTQWSTLIPTAWPTLIPPDIWPTDLPPGWPTPPSGD